MKHTTLVCSAALVLLTAGAGTVNAKPPAAPKPPVSFAAIDTNVDGKISRDEVRYMDDLNGAFGTLDANADKQLTPGEYAKWSRAARSSGSSAVTSK